jgi:glucose dehydrogenase
MYSNSINCMSTEEKHKNKNKNTVNTNSPYSIWTDTLLSKFGFKCLMNKHDLCTEGKCECLCHIHNQ